MLKRTSQFQYQLEQMADAIIATVALTVTIITRKWLHVWFPSVFPMFDALWSNAWLYMLLVPLWVFLLDFTGFYQHRQVRSPVKNMQGVIRANLLGIIITFFLLYVLKIENIPRILLILYGTLDLFLMWGKELMVKRFEPMWTEKTNILLIGEPKGLKQIYEQLRELPSWKATVLGMLLPLPQNRAESEGSIMGTEASLGGIPVLGYSDDLEKILHRESVDYVVISPGREYFDRVQKLIALCETEGVETWLAADFFRTSIARAYVDEFQDLPMLVFSTTPALSWALMLKRVIDVMGALVLLILLMPLMLAIVIAIRITSSGPIIFKQRRCTLHGREFWMYKFRTMVNEAENIRSKLEERNEMTGPVFKIKNDPRVTSIGKFLRRHSLDEFPQLFNVLAGDMSLVGPRPPIPSEVANYENWQRRRLSMRAGITCLWQVSGRNKLSFEDWMKLDLQYIDNWSLELDLVILLKTPIAIIRGTGC